MQLPLTHYPINPSTTSGSFLATILNDTEQALLSAQSGTSAPPVALAGTLWLNTANATNYILSLYSGSVWVQLFSFDPAAGIPSAGGQAVTSVNTRIGAVKIKELYDSTETVILASGTTDGIDMVINIDADPSTNLLPTMGRIAYDSTKNQFVGRDSTSWKPLGGGSYTQYPLEVIPDLGSISNSNIAGLQFRPLSSASDITIGAVPFSIPAPLWQGGVVIAIKNSGTFKIVFSDSSATASGLVTADPIELEPNKTIQFIYDSVTNRWYPSGSGSGGGGKWLTYPLEVLIAAGTITSLPDKFFQYRRITSGAAIDLSTTPFGTTIIWEDGIQVNVNNQGASPITFKNGSTIQFGFDYNDQDFILPSGQIASFQYDLIAERWYLIGSTSGGGGLSTANDQTMIAGAAINLLALPMQSIKLTAAAPVILNAIPFTIPLDMPDRSIITLIGTSNTNTIEVDYNATNAILFGNAVLGQNYILNLIYDKTNNYLIQTGKNY